MRVFADRSVALHALGYLDELLECHLSLPKRATATNVAQKDAVNVQYEIVCAPKRLPWERYVKPVLQHIHSEDLERQTRRVGNVTPT